jgi:hypothetical protein
MLFCFKIAGNLEKKDFKVKTENLSTKKKGKRKYLEDVETRILTNALNGFF